MPRTREVVVLSAILTAPLAALLVTASETPPPTPVQEAMSCAPAPAEDAPLELVVEPAPAPEPATVEVSAEVNAEVSAAPPAPEPPPGRDPSQLMLMHGPDLIVRGSAEPTWSAGKLRWKLEPWRLIVSQRAAVERLPDPLRALVGARVTVYGADGGACVADVGPMRVQYEETGEIAIDYGLTEEGADGEAPAPPSDQAVAALARQEFELGKRDRHLVARQRRADGRACEGVWARRSDLPAPAVFGQRELGEPEARALATSVLAALRQQPEFGELERKYAAYRRESEDHLDEPRAWSDLVADTIIARRWDEVGGPRRIVTVEVGPAQEPCSGAFGERVAVFFEERAGTFERLPQEGWLDVEAVMDVDRDGTLEVITQGDAEIRRQSRAAGPAAATFVDALTIPFHGCPC